MQIDIEGLCRKAREASRQMARLTTRQKDRALLEIAAALERRSGEILKENSDDVEEGKAARLSGALLDRLMLDEDRIRDMAAALRQLAALPDPVGEVIEGRVLPNGLELKKVRAPFGVIAVIYEARPNVTVDAAGLCLKAGSAVILRSGSASLGTARMLAEVINGALIEAGLPKDAVTLVESRDREPLERLLKMKDHVDLVVPRGGEALKDFLIRHSLIPVIYAAGGNCHVYVDAAADLKKALAITVNAKVQRPGVCNAAETLLVHEAVAAQFLPEAVRELRSNRVRLYVCPRTRAIIGEGGEGIDDAAEEHYATEFLDLVMAVKVVDSLDEATAHIAAYGTGHSEAIVTRDLDASRAFAAGVDAACVYINASTRFTDGGQFGMGAEIGISTQKLHARGPVGLKELTTAKYVITGDGQTRS